MNVKSNEQYAELLEVTAKRIRAFKNPIHEDIVMDLEVLASRVFNQGKEEIGTLNTMFIDDEKGKEEFIKNMEEFNNEHPTDDIEK